jgi:hypothetical protein
MQSPGTTGRTCLCRRLDQAPQKTSAMTTRTLTLSALWRSCLSWSIVLAPEGLNDQTVEPEEEEHVLTDDPNEEMEIVNVHQGSVPTAAKSMKPEHAHIRPSLLPTGRAGAAGRRATRQPSVRIRSRAPSKPSRT